MFTPPTPTRHRRALAAAMTAVATAGVIAACASTDSSAPAPSTVTVTAPVTTSGSSATALPSTVTTGACANTEQISQSDLVDQRLNLNPGLRLENLLRYTKTTPTGTSFFAAKVVDAQGRTVAKDAVWGLENGVWSGETVSALRTSDAAKRSARAFPEDRAAVSELAQCAAERN